MARRRRQELQMVSHPLAVLMCKSALSNEKVERLRDAFGRMHLQLAARARIERAMHLWRGRLRCRSVPQLLSLQYPRDFASHFALEELYERLAKVRRLLFYQRRWLLRSSANNCFNVRHNSRETQPRAVLVAITHRKHSVEAKQCRVFVVCTLRRLRWITSGPS